MPDGFGFGDISDEIGSLLASAVCFILDLLLSVECFLIQVAFFLYDLISFVGRLLLDALRKLQGIFGSLWRGGIRGFVSNLWCEYQKLTTWLKKVFGPYLQAIQQIYEDLQCIYDTYVKPVLDVLQRIRKVLYILHLLHLDFADALDKELALIEGKISGVFVALVKQLNEVATVINDIVDPLGLIHADILLRSLAGTIEDVFGQLHQLQDTGLGASDATSQAHDAARLTFDTASSSLATASSGTVPDDATAALADLAQVFQDQGFNPLT